MPVTLRKLSNDKISLTVHYTWNPMNRKPSALILMVLLASLPSFAQHAASEPVLDVSAMDKTVDPCLDSYT